VIAGATFKKKRGRMYKGRKSLQHMPKERHWSFFEPTLIDPLFMNETVRPIKETNLSVFTLRKCKTKKIKGTVSVPHLHPKTNSYHFMRSV